MVAGCLGESKLDILTYQRDSQWFGVVSLLLTIKYVVFEGNSCLPSQEKEKKKKNPSTRTVRKPFAGFLLIFYEASSALSIKD